MTKPGPVILELDPARLPPLEDGERRAIEALVSQPEASIDRSDIPPMTDAAFARARRNPFLRGRRAVTVHLDDDIVTWLGTDAGGREIKLAAILREAMSREGVRRRD